MTEEHEDADAVTESAGMPESPVDQVQEASAEASPNREAAKYRRQLREAEAERDQLRSQVETMQTAEVERRVSDALETPSDVWLAGVNLADVLGDDGHVDESKLDQAVLQVTTEHPGWSKRPQVGPDPDQGKTSDHSVSPSWTSLLRSGRQD